MSRSEVINEAPSRNRPTFTATFAPAALLGGLGCLGTAALLASTVPLSLYVITDALGAGAAVAFVVALVALPGYLRGQHATNYSRRVDEREPELVPVKMPFAVRLDEPRAKQLSRLQDEPRPGALRALADALSRGAQATEETAGRFGYSRDEWNALRDQWLEWGWVAWRNPKAHQQGLRFTRSGLMWLSRLADGLEMPKER